MRVDREELFIAILSDDKPRALKVLGWREISRETHRLDPIWEDSKGCWYDLDGAFAAAMRRLTK